jgi:hypothetical protein
MLAASYSSQPFAAGCFASIRGQKKTFLLTVKYKACFNHHQGSANPVL